MTPVKIKKQSMHNVRGKDAEYLVGMLLRPILRGKGKVVNKLKKPLKSWKRESCKSVSEDRVGIGERSPLAAAAIQLWGMRKSYHCVCTISSSPLQREPSRKGNILAVILQDRSETNAEKTDKDPTVPLSNTKIF